MLKKPEWWDWELELSQHLQKRMLDRQFNEVDLRKMLELAVALEPNHEPERWAVATRHEGKAWIVIVEPLRVENLLLVVTAYPVSDS